MVRNGQPLCHTGATGIRDTENQGFATMATTTPTGTRRGPGRPRKLPFDVREQLILDAAAEAFAARGSAGASVEAIAAAAGINKALVYEHHRSKDDLFAAVVIHERDRLVDFIATRYGRSVGRPLRERVHDRFHAFLDFAAAHPTSLGVLALPESRAVLGAAGRGSASADLARYLTDELGRAGLPHDQLPDVLAAMLVGMANEVIHQSADAPWDPEAVVDLLTDFTLAGLAGVDREVLERADRARADPPAPPERRR
jgi:AcrR family transcriptional regulator